MKENRSIETMLNEATTQNEKPITYSKLTAELEKLVIKHIVFG